MKLSIRQLIIAALLGGLVVVLEQLGIGRIPMPTGVAATILHIPAILGGIIEGPIVGLLVGFFFGLFSFVKPSNPVFSDPLVAFLPRLLIGIAAFYLYKAFGEGKAAIVVAAVGGTLTNTIGVLGLIVLRGYLPLKGVLVIAATHGIPEIIVSVIIVTPIVVALKRYYSVT